jgi:hypothetical protein
VQDSVARWYIFKPKIPIWVNFGIEDVGIFYGHFVHFAALPKWYIFWPFITFCGHLIDIFSPFGYVVQGKIWQPWCWIVL